MTLSGTAHDELQIYASEIAEERASSGRLKAELVLAIGRADGLLLTEHEAAARRKHEISCFRESIVRTAEQDRHRGRNPQRTDDSDTHTHVVNASHKSEF